MWHFRLNGRNSERTGINQKDNTKADSFFVLRGYVSARSHDVAHDRRRGIPHPLRPPYPRHGRTVQLHVGRFYPPGCCIHAPGERACACVVSCLSNTRKGRAHSGYEHHSFESFHYCHPGMAGLGFRNRRKNRFRHAEDTPVALQTARIDSSLFPLPGALD